MGYFQVDNGQVKIFFNLDSIRKVAEEKMMMLRRWAVGPSVNNSFPEHIFESTCPIVFKFYTQHP